jgi:hypothetical protein
MGLTEPNMWPAKKRALLTLSLFFDKSKGLFAIP